MPMPIGRIPNTTTANAANDARLAAAGLEVSPTGTPILPQSWVRPATIVGVTAAFLAGIPAIIASCGVALPAWVLAMAGVSGGVALLLAQLGIVSPGARK